VLQPVSKKIYLYLNAKLFCLLVEDEQQIKVHTLLHWGGQIMIMTQYKQCCICACWIVWPGVFLA